MVRTCVEQEPSYHLINLRSETIGYDKKKDTYENRKTAEG